MKIKGGNRYVLILLGIISLFRYYYDLWTPLSCNSLQITWISLILALVLFFCYHEVNPLLKKNYMRIVTIFLVGYILVHFFMYLAYLISDVDYIIGIDYIDSRVVNSAAICSLVSLITFLIGYCTTTHSFHIKEGFQISTKGKFLGIVQMLSFILFFITIDKRYFQGGYGEIQNHEGGLSVITSLSQQIFISSCIAKVILVIIQNKSLSFKQYLKSYSINYYIWVSIYCLLVIMSGDRGPLIQIAFSFLAGYFLINKLKFGIKRIIPLFLAGTIALNFLGALRSFTGGLNTKDISQAQSVLSDNMSERNVIFATTSELSVVVRSYNAIFYDAVKNGTISGLGFLDQLFGIVPGLRPLIIYPIFEWDKRTRPIDTNNLSTMVLNQDHGMGTSCCGDIFYNFGMIGTAFIFFVFGIFVKKMDFELYSQKHNVLAFAFAFNYLLLAVYLGRGKLLSPLNISLYTFILLYIVYRINTQKRRLL